MNIHFILLDFTFLSHAMERLVWFAFDEGQIHLLHSITNLI